MFKKAGLNTLPFNVIVPEQRQTEEGWASWQTADVPEMVEFMANYYEGNLNIGVSTNDVVDKAESAGM
jgi:hypothetical protein